MSSVATLKPSKSSEMPSMQSGRRWMLTSWCSGEWWPLSPPDFRPSLPAGADRCSRPTTRGSSKPIKLRISSRRPPVHHFINFVKFPSADACLVYLGHRAFIFNQIQSIQGEKSMNLTRKESSSSFHQFCQVFQCWSLPTLPWPSIIYKNLHLLTNQSYC